MHPRSWIGSARPPRACTSAPWTARVHAFARIRYAMPDARPSRFGIADRTGTSRTGRRRTRGTASTCTCPRGPRRPLPVVMYVHGGGFAMLSKDTHRVMALAIARAGYLVFNINYRQGPGTATPSPSRTRAWPCSGCATTARATAAIPIASRSPARARGATWSRRSPWPARSAARSPSRARVFDADMQLRAVVATYGFLDLGHTEQYLAHPRMSRWTKALLLDAARSYLGYDVRARSRGAPAGEPSAHHRGGGPDRPLPPFFVSVGTRDPLLRCSQAPQGRARRAGHRVRAARVAGRDPRLRRHGLAPPGAGEVAGGPRVPRSAHEAGGAAGQTRGSRRPAW